MSMLNIVDVHTYYGDSHVLQGVTLSVRPATVVAVLGRNGVGKTTLCRSIVGFTPARAGRIIFNDIEITRLPAHRIVRLYLNLVPQGRRIFPSLTVEENLAIARRAAGGGSRGTGQANGSPRPTLEREAGGRRPTTGSGWDLDTVFGVFPRLAERRAHYGNELSGGEQQMLAIARALVANPDLLVMDEPTEGLAPALVADVGHLIRRVRDEGTAVLLVEQNAAFAVKLADYVHVMSQGRIVHGSEPAALWKNEAIKTQYLGVPG
jgi:branched-chain amino acid transport system ATP-binding protein